MNQNPYECKFIWGSRALEDELRKKSKMLLKERGINLKLSALTHQLALDIKEGRVVLEPEIIRFRKANRMKLGNTMIKVKMNKPERVRR